jgi:hypothetical protein
MTVPLYTENDDTYHYEMLMTCTFAVWWCLGEFLIANCIQIAYFI